MSSAHEPPSPPVIPEPAPAPAAGPAAPAPPTAPPGRRPRGPRALRRPRRRRGGPPTQIPGPGRPAVAHARRRSDLRRLLQARVHPQHHLWNEHRLSGRRKPVLAAAARSFDLSRLLRHLQHRGRQPARHLLQPGSRRGRGHRAAEPERRITSVPEPAGLGRRRRDPDYRGHHPAFQHAARHSPRLARRVVARRPRSAWASTCLPRG